MGLVSLKPQLCFDLVIITTILLISAVAVRSDNGPLRLPSDQDPVDDEDAVCPMTTGGPLSCPVKCFRPDPVCGADGVTYWCGCADAHCAGTTVAKAGFCEVGSGGSGPVSGQALLLVHIIWLILLGIFVLFGLL